MVLDHAFDVLGLHRITAPISIDNEPAARAARRGGLVHEATMRAYFDAGGRPKDHALWAVTADLAPGGGFAAPWSMPGTPPRGRPRPVRDRVPSARAVVASTRFFAGSVKRCVPARIPVAVPAPVVGHRDNGSMFVLTAVPPHDLPRHRNGHVRPLTRRGYGTGISPADLRSGRALVFRVVTDRTPVGYVGLEGFDSVCGNAVLRVVSDTVEPHAALVSATTTLILHAFRVLGLRRIQTEVDPADPVASSFADAAGLEFEGLLSGIRTETGSFGARELWAAVADPAEPPAVTHTAGTHTAGTVARGSERAGHFAGAVQHRYYGRVV